MNNFFQRLLGLDKKKNNLREKETDQRKETSVTYLNPDSPASKDLLKRNDFATKVADSLIQFSQGSNDCIVVGISGSWGSGKTTFLNFVTTRIKDESEKAIVIPFNPWSKSGTPEDLQRFFLETIIKSLDKVHWKSDLGKKNEKLKKYLSYFQYLEFLKHAHPVVKNVTEAITDYRKKVSILSLDDLKKDIDKLILDQGLQVFITIDDLDRLDPDEIISIFKTIKLTANFANTVFIVAYDQTVVVDALSTRFNERSRDYLEKIIQVNFTIPEILEELIEDIFFEKLNSLFNRAKIIIDNHELYQLWKYRGLRDYFFNIRDINRYFNSLQLSITTIAEDINVADFIALEAIKVFDYVAYEQIHSTLVSSFRLSSLSDHTIEESGLNQLGGNPTKALIKYLFGENKAKIGRDEPLNKKRLHSREYFERYFALHISEKDISEAILSEFLLPGSNKKNLLSEIYNNGKMKNFLRRVGDRSLSTLYDQIDHKIFASFLDFWEEKNESLDSEYFSLIWDAYFNLAHSSVDKFEAAREAFAALVLQDSHYKPVRFSFNHRIEMIRTEKRRDPQFRDEVQDLYNVSWVSLHNYFDKYIANTFDTFLWNAYKFPSVIGNKFLTALATHHPNQYKSSLERYLGYPEFVYFLLANNFNSTDEEDNFEKSMVELSKKDLLLPGELYDRFIGILRKIKIGELNERQINNVHLFLDAIGEKYD